MLGGEVEAGVSTRGVAWLSRSARAKAALLLRSPAMRTSSAAFLLV
jgi:hypothetical protein